MPSPLMLPGESILSSVEKHRNAARMRKDIAALLPWRCSRPFLQREQARGGLPCLRRSQCL
jgi:hypothetical protein